METLPESIEVSPDRGVIGFYGDHIDDFDLDLPHEPRSGVLESNGNECYLHTKQTSAPITLLFTPSVPEVANHELLGETVLDIPTGGVVVSEVTMGDHGPFELPDGPGSYRVRIYGDPSRALRAAEVVDRLLDDDTEGPLRARENGENLERYYVRLGRLGEASEPGKHLE
ncbi:hypothetical protein ACOQFL_14780 [Actinopolyspora sp. H202]|uniref:hypothetical protein n=1 Tax=Actinopolyspora sp. H202 TaxID=1500456 RepID=UPI003EE80CFB